jgi:hypothetical protein
MVVDLGAAHGGAQLQKWVVWVHRVGSLVGSVMMLQLRMILVLERAADDRYPLTGVASGRLRQE